MEQGKAKQRCGREGSKSALPGHGCSGTPAHPIRQLRHWWQQQLLQPLRLRMVELPQLQLRLQSQGPRVPIPITKRSNSSQRTMEKEAERRTVAEVPLAGDGMEALGEGGAVAAVHAAGVAAEQEAMATLQQLVPVEVGPREEGAPAAGGGLGGGGGGEAGAVREVVAVMVAVLQEMVAVAVAVQAGMVGQGEGEGGGLAEEGGQEASNGCRRSY